MDHDAHSALHQGRIAMIGFLKKVFGDGEAQPPRRMEDDMPSYIPPGVPQELSPEEREQRAFQTWYASLPEHLKPRVLHEAFPAITLKIVDLWGKPAQCNAYLDQILIANREGRQGFPPGVAQELLALGAFYKERYRDLIGIRPL